MQRSHAKESLLSSSTLSQQFSLVIRMQMVKLNYVT